MSSQKLYELRTYEIRPSNVKKYMEESAKALPIRFQHSPCIGFFTSEVGSLNETIHLWEYGEFVHVFEKLFCCFMRALSLFRLILEW